MFSQIRQRELTSTAQKSSSSSHNLVERLKRINLLEGHTGCVNTVGFSDDGQLLISGSDDKRVNVWSWYTGVRMFGYKSGHRNNIFQARFLPHTNSSTVVTCAADGQVRIGYIRNNGTQVSTSLLASHGDRAHKLALDPEAHQCFYSCGEDGRVFHYDLRCPSARQSLLVCTKSTSEYRAERLQLHSIDCNPLRCWQFVVGGSDIFARVYDQRRSLTSTTAAPTSQPAYTAAALASPVRKLAPKSLRRQNKQFRCGEMTCHITCAKFSRQGEIVATYNDEQIHLFASEGPALGCEPHNPPEISNLRKRRKHGSSSEDLVPPPPAGAEAGVGTVTLAAAPASEAAEGVPRSVRQAALESSTPAPSATAAPSGPTETRDTARAAAGGGVGVHDPAETMVTSGAAAAEAREVAATDGVAARNCSLPGLPMNGSEVRQSSPSSSGAGSPSSSSNPEGSPLMREPPAASDAEVAAGDLLTSDDDSSGDVPGSFDSSGHFGIEQESLPSEGFASEDFGLEEDSDSEGSEGMEDDDAFGTPGTVEGLTSVDQEALPSDQHDDLAGFCDEVVMTFSGHRNCQTVKGVSFLGDDDEYVMSGSDDGHLYIWSKKDGVLRQWLRGDQNIVNCLEPHPTQPMAFATSGIDSDIKLWAPASPDPSPVSEEAAAVMERNTRARGVSHRRIPTASARNILLRLQHLAQSREEALQQVEAMNRQRGAAEGGPSDAAEGVQEALNTHRRFRRQFEDDLDDLGSQDEDEPPTPGDCTIA